MSSINELKSLEKEASLVSSIASILHWDQECYMPQKASDYRGEQMAFLAKAQHEKSTAKEIGVLIEKLQAESQGLSSQEKRSLMPISTLDISTAALRRCQRRWTTTR